MESVRDHSATGFSTATCVGLFKSITMHVKHANHARIHAEHLIGSSVFVSPVGGRSDGFHAGFMLSPDGQTCCAALNDAENTRANGG